MMWRHLYPSRLKYLLKRKVNRYRQYWQSGERNIHRSLTFIIIIAQIFGFFPVQSVFIVDVDDLKFTWLSWKVIVSLVSSLSACLISMAHIVFMIHNRKYDQFDMNGVFFYLCGGISSYLFIILAKEWPLLMKEWNRVEKLMAPTYGWPKKFDRRIRITSFIFLMLEAAEHLLIQSNKMIVSYNCKGSLEEGFKHFAVNLSFPQIFDFIDYCPVFAVLLQLINSKMAFSWTFVDLFLIIVSTALAVRFKQIKEKIQSTIDNKDTDPSLWRKLREDYSELSRLCIIMNKKLSNIILLSFGTNFYFIIFQLYDDLSSAETQLEMVYFVISFGLIVLRTFCICFYGSWIYEETKVIRSIVLAAQPSEYNKEIDVFMQIVRHHIIGFTGKNFFQITRGLILKIASAVVTYELILVQFSGKNLIQKKSSRNSMC